MKPSNEQMTEIKFEQLGDFSAVNAARNWLSEHGYSYGSMCMDMPIGIDRKSTRLNSSHRL